MATHTPGDVLFTPDGSKVMVTTKDGGNSIDVFRLGPGGWPAAQPVVNSEPGTLPFGAVFDAAGHLAVAEVGNDSVATFTVNGDSVLTPVADAATGQAATCWISAAGSLLYASNAGSNNVSGDLDAAGSLSSRGNTGTDPGTVDSAVSPGSRFLYVQAGVNGIVDEFAINPDGSLSAIGSVTVPDAVGGEGIVVS